MLSRTSLFNRHSSGIWLIILAIGVFLIGILTYLASNHAQMDARLLAIDIGTVISLIITGTLLMAKVISKRKAIIIFTLTVAAEVCLSIIFESINPLPESVERVMLLVTLCFFPALMSKLAGSYTCQVIVSVAAIISYITASFLLDCVIMYRVLPVYVAIHICILIISRYLQPAKDINDGEPEELGVPQIEHLLKLEPDKWHLLKQSRLNHTEVKKVVTGMGRKMEDKIINEAKVLFHKEEQIMGILKSKYPCLTMAELHICVLIVMGKTVSDICYIRNVSQSTVTSVRCQLRKKFGLRKDEILQYHLRSVVYNAAHNQDASPYLFKMRKIV